MIVLAEALLLLVLCFGLVLLGKLAFDRIFGFDMDNALFEEDNPAVGIGLAGYYCAMGVVLWAALHGMEASWLRDVGHTLAYGGWGIALLASGLVMLRPLHLRRLNLRDELLRDRNIGIGIVMSCALVATGLVVAAAILGETSGGLLMGIASMTGAFAVGQLSLALLVRLHGRFATFDILAEIERDNVAAACELGGLFLGNGIILFWGLRGDFHPQSLRASLHPLGVALLLGVLLLPLVRLVVLRVLFHGIPFDKEIVHDRNIAAGVLSLVAYGLVATVLTQAIG